MSLGERMAEKWMSSMAERGIEQIVSSVIGVRMCASALGSGSRRMSPLRSSYHDASSMFDRLFEKDNGD
ncbi:BQ5605_C034g11268 [Microbotryum silenes-dioicae]|uniref:BQ5605_C034g11268 protein n=1 Tax=Microbotryum silenes-dioicae TaxID=796604 RepID=A0A2X0MK16_9BASI|nr:BQ5605_C034g11268 [Microbotryum silenes-dioicae]